MNINPNNKAPLSDSMDVCERKTFAEMNEEEKIDFVAAKIIDKYRPAFEELAK